MRPIHAAARLLPGYIGWSVRSPVFLICAFLAFAAAGLDLKIYSSAGWGSAGEFGRHVYGLATLLGPLMGTLMIWRLALLDRTMEEVVLLRADDEAGPLAARALAAALAALLATLSGTVAAGLVNVIGQDFTFAGLLVGAAYLLRGFTALLIWAGLAGIGTAAAANAWGAFPLPIVVWVTALLLGEWLPESLADAARALVMTDAGVVSPMTPWGVGLGSALSWIGAFTLVFIGCTGIAANVLRLRRRTWRWGAAIAAVLCWGLLPPFLSYFDPVRMEMAIKGEIETSYPVIAGGLSRPEHPAAGVAHLDIGPMVLHRPLDKPVPDELLPAYRAVWAWLEAASWEEQIKDVWVIPDFSPLPPELMRVRSQPILAGENLLVSESTLRRFRTGDRLAVALKLTESLEANRPARLYLALWLISGGKEREVRPLLAFLERYGALDPPPAGDEWRQALAWTLPDQEVQRLSGQWGDQALPAPGRNDHPDPLSTPNVAPAPNVAAGSRPDQLLSQEELRFRDVMFSLLRRWGRDFHLPYQFSSLEAHLVLRHWDQGQQQGHLPYITHHMSELQQKGGSR